MAYRTQLSILLGHMAAGRWPEALKLAARWQNLGDEKEAITRGKDALVHPEFYEQLGKDPAVLIQEGIEALKERYWKKEKRNVSTE